MDGSWFRGIGVIWPLGDILPLGPQHSDVIDGVEDINGRAQKTVFFGPITRQFRFGFLISRINGFQHQTSLTKGQLIYYQITRKFKRFPLPAPPPLHPPLQQITFNVFLVTDLILFEE